MDALFLIDRHLVLFVLRLVLGVVMIYYGQSKIRDLEANTKDFVSMGLRPAWFWGTMVAFVEFIGGIGMVLGIFAPLWALAFGIEMIGGTIWKIKSGKSFRDYSYDLQLLAMCLVIIAFGAGSFSLGNMLI